MIYRALDQKHYVPVWRSWSYFSVLCDTDDRGHIYSRWVDETWCSCTQYWHKILCIIVFEFKMWLCPQLMVNVWWEIWDLLSSPLKSCLSFPCWFYPFLHIVSMNCIVYCMYLMTHIWYFLEFHFHSSFVFCKTSPFIWPISSGQACNGDLHLWFLYSTFIFFIKFYEVHFQQEISHHTLKNI